MPEPDGEQRVAGVAGTEHERSGRSMGPIQTEHLHRHAGKTAGLLLAPREHC